MDLSALLSGRLAVSDGAWGTELQKRGLGRGDCAEGWNLDHPDRVREVAESYVVAGSEVILTNTFGGNRFALERHGLAEHVTEVNEAGATISRAAAGESVLVAGSVGPTGKLLMMGEVSAEEVRAAFDAQVEALRAGGVDLICVETMSDVEEALLAVEAAKSAGLPVVACMTYDSGPDKTRTMMGLEPAQTVPRLLAAGADVVGANCGLGIEGYARVCELIRAQTDGPVWIKPNAGLPERDGGQTVYRQSPEEFCSFVPALLNAGATVVGGCCGTTPEHIRLTVELLRKS